MRFPRYVQVGVSAAAIAGIFLFPWPLTATLAFLAGLAFPPVPLAVGIIADLLYYPGSGWWYATGTGLCLALLAVLVRRFVKERIM